MIPGITPAAEIFTLVCCEIINTRLKSPSFPCDRIPNRPSCRDKSPTDYKLSILITGLLQWGGDGVLGTAGLARLPQPSLPSSICIYSCLIPCSQGCHSQARMLSIHINCSVGVEHQQSDKCIGVMHRFPPVPGGFGVTSCNVIKSGNKNLHKWKFERDLLLGEDS